jgi:hypothetical protein
MSPEYVQKACRCRRNWMCPFCRQWLQPNETPKGSTKRDHR